MRTCALPTVALLLFAASVPGQEANPRIGGNTLEQWIKEIAHKDPDRQTEAIQMVALFHPERAYQAVPALLELLKRHTADKPLDISVRVHAVLVLGLAIGAARDAEPKHVKEALQLFVRLADDPQTEVKRHAVQALGRLGGAVQEAVPRILTLAVNPKEDAHTREAAVKALGQIPTVRSERYQAKVFQALIESLKDPARRVRLAAVDSLTWHAHLLEAEDRTRLLKALDVVADKDESPINQIRAHLANMLLTRTYPDERVVVLRAFLKHADKEVREAAEAALSFIEEQVTPRTAPREMPPPLPRDIGLWRTPRPQAL